MGRRSSPVSRLSHTVNGKPVTVPWWRYSGWVVTWDEKRVYGWRQWKAANVSRPFSFPHRGRSYLDVLRAIERVITVLKKAEKPRVDGVAASVADPALAKRCPMLAAHLTQASWEDGTPRQVSTLSIFTGDGAWKACLRDRENGLCLWVAATAFDRLPGALETALGDENTVWRADRQQPGDTASRQRKQKGS